VNHPVRDESTGRVFVTSQNHGFAVDEKSLPEGFTVRFRNANDGSVEGLENKKLKILCVQHHPEASPGPADSSWIFDSFLDTIKE
jgi:carbamoyl-phosphate synthase small subunit